MLVRVAIKRFSSNLEIMSPNCTVDIINHYVNLRSAPPMGTSALDEPCDTQAIT